MFIKKICECYIDTITFSRGNIIFITLRFLLFRIRKRLGILPSVLSISRSKIVAIRRDGAIAAAIYTLGYYDYHNMFLIKKLMLNLKTYVDVGANIGVYSLLASETKSAKVYAVEPYKPTFNHLVRNIRANRRHNVRAFNLAMGARNGMAGLAISCDDSGHQTVNASENRIKIKRVSMVSFCRQNNIVPTVVKIDTEGSELDIIIGLGRMIKQVKVMFVELNEINRNNHTEHKIIRYMRSYNFQGPYHYSADSSLLSLKIKGRRYNSIEDSIFVAKNWLKDLRCLGVGIEN